MYGWIWRKLPFGIPGKLVGSLMLFGGVAALLWFYAFPALAPLMPGNQSTIDTPGGDSDGGGDGSSREVDENGVPSFDPSDYELESSPPPSEE